MVSEIFFLFSSISFWSLSFYFLSLSSSNFLTSTYFSILSFLLRSFLSFLSSLSLLINSLISSSVFPSNSILSFFFSKYVFSLTGDSPGSGSSLWAIVWYLLGNLTPNKSSNNLSPSFCFSKEVFSSSCFNFYWITYLGTSSLIDNY